MSDKQKSIIAMLISSFGFSLMAVFVKLTGDIPIMQKVVIRTYIMMVTIYIMMKHYKVSLGHIKHFKLLTLRSFLGTIGIILNFYAVDHLLLSDAGILFRISNFLLLFFSWIFLKEGINRKQFLTICAAFLGVLFIIKPQFNIAIIPYVVALLGASFAAGAYTVVRKLSGKEAPLVIVFFFSAFTSVVLTPFVVMNFKPMTGSQVLFAILAGISASIGQVGVTYSYKHAPAKEVSIYNYFGVIFSALLGFLFFGALPDGYSLIGYVIIFASGYYMYHMNTRLVND